MLNKCVQDVACRQNLSSARRRRPMQLTGMKALRAACSSAAIASTSGRPAGTGDNAVAVGRSRKPRALSAAKRLEAGRSLRAGTAFRDKLNGQPQGTSIVTRAYCRHVLAIVESFFRIEKILPDHVQELCSFYVQPLYLTVHAVRMAQWIPNASSASRFFYRKPRLIASSCTPLAGL